MSAPAHRLRAVFDGRHPGGHRALLDVLPPRTPVAVALVLQPLGDEANFARRVLVLQARRLADAGLLVRFVDLHACGDSAGDGPPRLDVWHDDAIRAAMHLREAHPDVPFVLWGVRFGALLARHVADTIRPDLLLGWDAPASGKALETQLRRLARLSTLSSPGQAAPSAGLRVGGLALSDDFLHGLVTLPGFERADPGALAMRAPAAYWMEQAPAPLDAFMDEVREAVLGALGVPHAAIPGPMHRDGQTCVDTSPEVGASVEPPIDETPDRSMRPRVAAGHDEGMEVPVEVPSAGRRLRGVLHLPAHAGTGRRAGLLVLPGRPQTRVGSHRLFVQLARACAAEGHPVLRLDHAGHGDSDGEPLPLDAVADDVRAALAVLGERFPDHPPPWLWGLCDGATSGLLTMRTCTDIGGLVALNPWFHDRQVRARTMVQAHYRGRLVSREFWLRLLRGGVKLGPAVREAFGHLRTLAGNLRTRGARDAVPSLPDRARLALLGAPGHPVHVLLSGEDMTADEVRELLASRSWRQAARRIVRHELAGADHTLTAPAAQADAVAITLAALADTHGVPRSGTPE